MINMKHRNYHNIINGKKAKGDIPNKIFYPVILGQLLLIAVVVAVLINLTK